MVNSVNVSLDKQIKRRNLYERLTATLCVNNKKNPGTDIETINLNICVACVLSAKLFKNIQYNITIYIMTINRKLYTNVMF